MSGATSSQSSTGLRDIAVWMVAAAGSAYASSLVARSATPIDAALPFIVVLLTAVAVVSQPAVQLSVPLLIGGAVVLHDERQRLLWFGLVIGLAFGAAILRFRGTAAAVTLALAAVLLLRWIPLEGVLPGREVMILVFTVAIVLVLGSTPLSIAVSVGAALFTPAVPLRTLLIPAAVLIMAALARLVRGHRIRLAVPAATTAALMLIFFAWSGAFARALPVMLRGGPPRLQRIPVNIALPAGAAAEVEIPPHGRGLILSGANVPRLKRGTVLGRVQPGDHVVRIGDVADWGVLRREHWYNSRNPLPARPGGLIRGYGQTAWIDASGRIATRPGRITVVADRGLPAGASLQIDAIELGP